ncbi:MAG: hypothetical protein ACTSV5_01970 [Promethearchaeota archaeon]
MKLIYKHSRKTYNRIKKFYDKFSRIHTAKEDYFRKTRPELEFSINNAIKSPIFDGKATVAQTFDFNVASRYYCLLTVSMITRLCKSAISNHPESEVEIDEIKNDFENWIKQKTYELLSGIEIEVIPIQKLVRVQIGSAFITLANLTKERFKKKLNKT